MPDHLFSGSCTSSDNCSIQLSPRTERLPHFWRLTGSFKSVSRMPHHELTQGLSRVLRFLVFLTGHPRSGRAASVRLPVQQPEMGRWIAIDFLEQPADAMRSSLVAQRHSMCREGFREHAADGRCRHLLHVDTLLLRCSLELLSLSAVHCTQDRAD